VHTREDVDVMLDAAEQALAVVSRTLS
jgi:hypothetical protein